MGKLSWFVVERTCSDAVLQIDRIMSRNKEEVVDETLVGMPSLVLHDT
jgi:hypothetical protein